MDGFGLKPLCFCSYLAYILHILLYTCNYTHTCTYIHVYILFFFVTEVKIVPPATSEPKPSVKPQEGARKTAAESSHVRPEKQKPKSSQR